MTTRKLLACILAVVGGLAALCLGAILGVALLVRHAADEVAPDVAAAAGPRKCVGAGSSLTIVLFLCYLTNYA